MVGLFLLAARWFIAGIFLRSGLAKAAGLAEFRSAVANYQLLPPSFVTVTATALPFAEIAAAVLLAFGVLPTVVAAILALLLVVFSVAIALNLARGRVFDCGCGGSAVAPSKISWRHVAVNLLLAIVAAAIAVAPPPTAELWRGPVGPVRVAAESNGAFPILLAILVCLVVMTVFRRAAAVRGLAATASRQLDVQPLPPPRRH